MNGNHEAVSVKERGNGSDMSKTRTTIGLKAVTKDKLDRNRAPGQCYDGFIFQLVDLWERTSSNGK